MFMLRHLSVVIITALLFTACQKPAANTAYSNTSASPNAKRYPIQGKVISVDQSAKTITLEHGDIEGLMPGMTMPFPVHADWVWNDLKPGAEIRAEIVEDKEAPQPYWLENVGILAAPDPNDPAPTPNNNFAQIGQPVPDFKLTDQDGKPISIKSFEGKALAITFIYAKCPLPDYCIKMSANFSDIANQLKSNAELKDKVRLLSISFDPENDTPAKLRSYGIGYLGNDPKAKFDIWSLAVGSDIEVRKIADFFGLDYKIDPDNKAVFNHNLRTAVIGPDGRVTKIFPGNQWTKADLLKELEAAALNAK